MTVRERDNGAERLLRDAAKPVKIRVGIMGMKGDAGHADSEDTVAGVATKHEFGVGVQQRSFIREWADEQVDDNRELLRRIARAVTRGTPTVEVAAEQVVLSMIGSIQERMAASPSSWPQLSEEYADRVHGGDRTPRLINTGQLRSSITGLSDVDGEVREVQGG